MQKKRFHIKLQNLPKQNKQNKKHVGLQTRPCEPFKGFLFLPVFAVFLTAAFSLIFSLYQLKRKGKARKHFSTYENWHLPSVGVSVRKSFF